MQVSTPRFLLRYENLLVKRMAKSKLLEPLQQPKYADFRLQIDLYIIGFTRNKPSCSVKYQTVHSWYCSFIAHLTYTSEVNSALQEHRPCRCNIQYMYSKPSHTTGKICPRCYKQLQDPSNIRDQTLSCCKQYR